MPHARNGGEADLDEILMMVDPMQGSRASLALTLDAMGFPQVDGQPLKLPPKERAVLGLLLRRHGAVVSKDEFAVVAWRGQEMSDESLARCISQVRRAVRPLGLKVEALYGLGYRLDSDRQSEPPHAEPSAESRSEFAHVRQLLQQRTPAAVGLAMERARALIAAEPGYAAARVALADALAVAANWGQVPTPVAVQEGLDVLAAVAPSESGVDAARGALLDMAWRFDEAAVCFQRVKAMDGDNAEALLACSRHLLFTNQAEQAVQLLRRVRELAPHALHVRMNLARALVQSGQGDAAVQELHEAQADHPGQLVLLSFTLAIQAMVSPRAELGVAARRLTDGLDTPPFVWTVASFVYARLGLRDEALDIIDTVLLCSATTAGEASLYAAPLAAIGEFDRAAELLERAAAERSGMLAMVLRDPAHAGWLPDHPRGRALLQMVFGDGR